MELFKKQSIDSDLRIIKMTLPAFDTWVDILPKEIRDASFKARNESRIFMTLAQEDLTDFMVLNPKQVKEAKLFLKDLWLPILTTVSQYLKEEYNGTEEQLKKRLHEVNRTSLFSELKVK